MSAEKLYACTCAHTHKHINLPICAERVYSRFRKLSTVQLGEYCQNVTIKHKPPHYTVVEKKIFCVNDKKLRFRFFGFVFSFLGHPAGRENILISPSCDGLPSSDCPHLSSLNVRSDLHSASISTCLYLLLCVNHKQIVFADRNR